MKSISLGVAALLVVATSLSSCSYNQFGAIATGSSLGGMFGSSIGGLMGGPRGSDKGTLAGMVIGGVVGAAVTSQQNKKTDEPVDEDMTYRPGRSSRTDAAVEYDTYDSPSYPRSAPAQSDLEYLEVTNVKFLDSNNNRSLDADESAYLVMDIYNRGERTLYNVAPQISCSNSRVLISPSAIVGNIPSGGGVRYKAALRAPRRLRDGRLVFTVSFGTGRQSVQAKQVSIRCGAK